MIKSILDYLPKITPKTNYILGHVSLVTLLFSVGFPLLWMAGHSFIVLENRMIPITQWEQHSRFFWLSFTLTAIVISSFVFKERAKADFNSDGSKIEPKEPLNPKARYWEYRLKRNGSGPYVDLDGHGWRHIENMIDSDKRLVAGTNRRYDE